MVRSDILALNGSNALLEFLLHSSPGVQEHLLDSKKEVDRRLKAVCEQFIAETSGGMLGSLTTFTARAVGWRGEAGSRLVGQSWAQPAVLANAVTEAVRLVRQRVPAIQRKMQLYLANRETEFILFRPVSSHNLLVGWPLLL